MTDRSGQYGVLMDTESVDWNILASEAEMLRKEGASVMYLAADNTVDRS